MTSQRTTAPFGFDSTLPVVRLYERHPEIPDAAAIPDKISVMIAGVGAVALATLDGFARLLETFNDLRAGWVVGHEAIHGATEAPYTGFALMDAGCGEAGVEVIANTLGLAPEARSVRVLLVVSPEHQDPPRRTIQEACWRHGLLPLFVERGAVEPGLLLGALCAVISPLIREQQFAVDLSDYADVLRPRPGRLATLFCESHVDGRDRGAATALRARMDSDCAGVLHGVLLARLADPKTFDMACCEDLWKGFLRHSDEEAGFAFKTTFSFVEGQSPGRILHGIYAIQVLDMSSLTGTPDVDHG